MGLVTRTPRSRGWALFGAALASSCGWPSTARAEPCGPVHLVSAAPMPDAWQRAADTLVEATATPGRPWSCPDTELVIAVDADGSGAVLRMATPRGVRERRVVTPDDLVSTGKAWLSVLPPPEAPAPKVEPPQANTPPAIATAADLEKPRAQLGASFGPRFESPTNALWLAAEVRAAVPFGPWSIGTWFRVAAATDVFDRVPADFTMSEVVLGALLERRLDVGAYTLRGAFLPAITVITMEGGLEKNEESGEKFDARVGVRLGVARRLSPTWRVTLDGEAELAPLALRGGPSRHIHPLLPEVPAWGVGAELGVEAWVH